MAKQPGSQYWGTGSNLLGADRNKKVKEKALQKWQEIHCKKGLQEKGKLAAQSSTLKGLIEEQEIKLASLKEEIKVLEKAIKKHKGKGK